jgi:hypothetical protein
MHERTCAGDPGQNEDYRECELEEPQEILSSKESKETNNLYTA